MRVRDIDIKETLTTRPTTVGGALLLLLVVLFFVDDVLILLIILLINPVVGIAIILALLAVYAWRTDRI